MATVYLGVGSNVGNRLANLRAALDALRPSVLVDATSSVYETEPAYLEAQPPFANMVARALTGLDPFALLRLAKAIEWQLGRRPGERNGPRPVDLDVLFYDDLVLATPELVIPHPRILERSFVLVPLAELAADLAHPALTETIGQHLAATPRLLGKILRTLTLERVP